MRWPLRNQIMLPMIGVMLGALVSVSALNAYLSGRRVKQQIEHQLQEVASTLSESSFPLTSAVLRQMRGLTGAEFVLVSGFESNHPEQVLASFTNTEAVSIANSALLQAQPQPVEALTLGKSIRLGNQRYFHTAVQLRRHNTPEQTIRLHLLYPEQSYREVWRQAVYPPLVIGALAIFLVVLFAIVIALRVVRPLLRLQNQVERIAKGDFRRMELPLRNDEVRDLSKSVSRMANLLSRYEDEIRHSERLRTLGQLGSGIAHQLRNSATGCRLAIELHQRECPPGCNCDCLDVANRQITLMEKQLKRFLSLGNPSSKPTSLIDLTALVDSSLPLLQPFARHLHVEIEWNFSEQPFMVRGDSDALEQLLINLLLNAIEAAAQCEGASLVSTRQAKVAIHLDLHKNDWILLEVADSGTGPPQTIQNELFEPFVSDKPDGTGLGLSVAREIVEQHDGKIRWNRRSNMTCFSILLPLHKNRFPKATLTSVETQGVKITRS